MKNSIQTALSEEAMKEYIGILIQTNKSQNTIKKYQFDLRKFREFLDWTISRQKSVGGDILVKYQKSLLSENYECRSINSYVSSAYRLCRYLGLPVINPQPVRPDEVELDDENEGLTNAEYQRLLRAAFRYDMEQTGMMLQVLVGTSLRYSEMEYITMEVLNGDGIVEYERQAKYNRKIKIRLPEELVAALKEYAEEREIVSGIVFRNSRDKFPHRSNAWRSMKRLCKFADVEPSKVSPQKIKNAFVKDFYSTAGRKIKK